MKAWWLCLLAAGAAFPARGAGKLDKDAEHWLGDVHLLILPDEDKVFRSLEDAADRQEFQRIFWARRDPDPATPASELESAVARARTRADQLFSTSVRRGSTTGCGQVFILLGEPGEIEGRDLKVRFDNAAVMREGARRPETWIYRSRPGDPVELTGGELRIAFDEDCRFAEGGRVLDDLRRVAGSKVVRPQITYRLTPDRHLVRLEELRKVGPAPARVLDAARTDFPLLLEPKLLLRAGNGQGYAAGLIRADLSGLPSVEGARPAVLAATVVAQAIDASGQAVPAFERAVRGAVGGDGAFIASYGLPLKPGRYALRVGLVVGDKTAVAATPVEVPDYDSPGLKLGSLVVYPDVPDAGPADAQSADGAFSVGAFRLHPRLGNVFSRSDSLQAVCVLYGGEADAATGKPSLTARFRFLKDGKPVASSQEETFDTAMAAASVGPVPLATFAPGRYVARVEARDVVSGRSETQDTPFEIKP